MSRQWNIGRPIVSRKWTTICAYANSPTRTRASSPKPIQIDIDADPRTARRPVPPTSTSETKFALWLFGDEKHESIVSDSRQVDEFGRVLLSKKAVEYLERTPRPSFDVARRMAGVDEDEISKHIERAADEIEEALKAAHHHKDSARLQAAVRGIGLDALQLLDVFPSIKDDLLSEAK